MRKRVTIIGLLVGLLTPVAVLGVDYATHALSTVARPAIAAPLTDPLGGILTRRTDPTFSPNEEGNQTLGLIHEYSRFPVLSADNRQVVVQVIGGKYRGGWEVRDLSTHVLQTRLDTNGDPEFSWHPLDKDRLFYRYANEIRVFHVDTGKVGTLMTFPQYDTIGTNEEGRPSDDWRYYAFLGRHGDSTDIVVADLVAKKILATMPLTSDLDWVSMSPSGKYVVVMWTDGQGTTVYNRALTPLRKLLSDYAHSDFAFDAQGNEVLVYQASSGGQLDELGCPNPPSGSPLASARLADGKKKILLGDCNTAEWQPVITGTFLGWDWWTAHFSGIASRTKPGWILVSTYAAPGAVQQPFGREIFWLALDGGGKVRRLAQHHSDVAVNADGDKDYFAEPHATSSWDGSIVVTASVWGTPWQHYDLYTVTATPPPAPPPCK